MLLLTIVNTEKKIRQVKVNEGIASLREQHRGNMGILVYNICLISISNSVSDGATNKSVLNIERS